MVSLALSLLFSAVAVFVVDCSVVSGAAIVAVAVADCAVLLLLLLLLIVLCLLNVSVAASVGC